MVNFEGVSPNNHALFWLVIDHDLFFLGLRNLDGRLTNVANVFWLAEKGEIEGFSCKDFWFPRWVRIVYPVDTTTLSSKWLVTTKKFLDLYR